MLVDDHSLFRSGIRSLLQSYACFEVIGEALNQLAKLDAAMAARIPDVPQVVAFRNQLICAASRSTSRSTS